MIETIGSSFVWVFRAYFFETKDEANITIHGQIIRDLLVAHVSINLLQMVLVG